MKKCSCGRNMQAEREECWVCRIPSRVRKDSCGCGQEKALASVICLDCYREQARNPSILGPYPDSGQIAIYLLRNPMGVFYVGSTYRPNRRYNDHRKDHGKDIEMLIIKLVDEKDRWREEMMATLEYERFLPNGIRTANPANIGREL